MRNLTGIWKWLVFFITAFGVAFIVFTSLWRPYHPALQGSAVLLIGMLLVFLNQPISKEALKKDHSDLMRIILFGSDHSPSAIDLASSDRPTSNSMYVYNVRFDAGISYYFYLLLRLHEEPWDT